MSGIHHPKYNKYYDLCSRVEGLKSLMIHMENQYKISENPADGCLYYRVKNEYDDLLAEKNKLFNEIYFENIKY